MDVIQRLKQKAAGLVKRIKDFISKWVQKLREFYKENKAISQEASLASQLKTFEKIQEMFLEALDEAGENFRNAETVVDETVDNDVQFSDKDGFEIRTFPIPRGAKIDADKYIVEKHGLVLDDIRQHLPELETMEFVYELDGTEFQNNMADTRKLKPKVKKYFKDIGGKVWRKELGYIELNNAGVNDSLSHGYGPLKAACFAALPSVIEKGLLFGPNKYMERGYDTYFFVGPVKFTGSQKGEFYVGAYVIKDANTTRYKIHEVLTVNKKGNRPLKPEADLNGERLRGDFLSDTRVTQPNLEVKENSDYIESFSDRNTPLSNRALLANALTSAVQNEEEARILSEYEYKVSQIEATERYLSELRKKIYEKTFGRGLRDDAYRAELDKYREDALRTERRLNRMDKELLEIEAMRPVADILKREKKAVKKRAEAKYNIKLADYQKKAAEELEKQLDAEKEKAARKRTELLEKYYKDRQKALANQRTSDSDKRKRMEMRKKIQKDIRDLTKMLKRSRDERNVKEEMKDLAASTIAQAEALFIDYYTNDDIIRNGVGPGIVLTESQSMAMNEAGDILKQLDDPSNPIYDPSAVAREQYLRGRLNSLKARLKEVFLAERNRMGNATASELMSGVFKAYKELASSDKEYVRNAYDPQVLEHLQGITERFDNVKARDMSLRQLEDLHKAYTMVLHTIRTANKAFTESRSVEQLAKSLVSELKGQRKISRSKLMTTARNAADMIGWNYEKLYYALERVGADTLTRLFNNLANSENIVMQDAMEAKIAKLDLIDKYGYKNWEINKQIDQEFMDNHGKTFRMTLGEMMLLYAYVRRGTVNKQLETGGFVFGEKVLVDKLTDTTKSNAYKLTRTQCISITNALTDQQKRFVEDMQDYLSDNMGAKGNEVSMQLYGVELFEERHYMPVHVAGEYHSRAEESKAKDAAGFASMKNAGFTKSKNVEAKAPIVMESFMDVWTDHVNEMSRYHGTVPALEDIRRVMNYSVYNDAETESISVKAALENSCGKQAVNYFDSLYREANSGAVMDKLQGFSKQALSKMRKLGVAYSLSVVVQQPASLVRAYSMINKKYFGDIRIPGLRGVGTLPVGVVKTAINRWTQSQTNAYAEMLKYAPGVTMAKEIGGFDTASGSSIRTYLMDDGKTLKQKVKTGTGTEKVKAIANVIDDNPVANIPNLADKMAWIEIWNACKRETKDRFRNLPADSEQFMKRVGERFTEVIRATQVYDSIFSKSPLLKSKNAAVQYVVSFMNEPNTVANMVESAFRDFRKGKKLEGAKKIGAVIRSTVLTCALKCVVYAMRDDDEDEAFIEKYVQALTSNLIGDFTGFNYIPVLGDIWSVFQGYEVERPDMAIYADVIQAGRKYYNLHEKDVSNMTPGELDEGERSCTSAGWSLVGSIAGCFGIPVNNITREVKAIFNTIKTCGSSAGETTWESSGDAAWQGVVDELPWVDAEKNTDQLYQAITEDNSAYLERLKQGYVDPDGKFKEKSYHTALRKGLRENDSRIQDAAQARRSMNTEEYLRIVDEIVAEGCFDKEDVVAAVRSEYNAMKGDNVSTQLYEALTSGDTETAEELKGSFVNDKGEFSTDSYQNAIRKGLRENDPRIQKAAEAKANGDTDAYFDIVEGIVEEGNFKWTDVSAAVKVQVKELEEG